MTKPLITPGHAILLVINQYNKENKPVEEIDKLKKMYLCGFPQPEDKIYLNSILGHPILSKYEIARNGSEYDARAINADSTRAYFETQLSYQTVVAQIGKSDSNPFTGPLKFLEHPFLLFLMFCEARLVIQLFLVHPLFLQFLLISLL